MQRLASIVGSILALSLSACGQVTQDADRDPPNPPGTNPPGTNPPGTNPPGTDPPGKNPPGTTPPARPNSAVCPSAAVEDSERVALFTTRGQDLVFVRHDGSELVAHSFAPDLAHSSVSVRTNGDRILALAAESWDGEHSELVIFDRRGIELDSLLVSRALHSAFIDENGAVVAGGATNDEVETLRWSDGSLVEIASGWAPIGLSGAGHVVVRKGWDGHDAHGFLNLAAGTITEVTQDSAALRLVSGKLVALDATQQNLVIHSPEGASMVPVAHPDFDSAPMILRTRSEGWVLVGNEAPWDAPLTRTVAVIDVRTGDARWLKGPMDPGQSIAMYCDSAREGYLASDGSVFFSKPGAGGGIELVRHPANGESPTPLGKPLAKIAYLDVTERAGGYVVRASDGSDTYCGAPDPAEPPVAGAAIGNSVHAGRVSSDLTLRQLEFGGTWFQHTLDVSGSCVLGPTADAGTPEYSGYRVDDLLTGTSFELAPNPRGSEWIE